MCKEEKANRSDPNLRGRKRTVTVTLSFDPSISNASLSPQKYCGLSLTDEDAGELCPSTEASGTCLEDEVVDEVGELAGLDETCADLLCLESGRDAMAGSIRRPPRT